MASKLAQMFDLLHPFEDGKVSVYLKRSGENLSSYYDLTDGLYVLDATNFSSVTQNDHKIVIDDRYADFTGNGYMRTQSVSGGSQWAILSYPVKTLVPRKYNAYFRVRASGGSINLKIYIDNVQVDVIAASPGTNWAWIQGEFVLPDLEEHVLSIGIEDDDVILDKIYINKDSDSPVLTGPDYTQSPFVTIHLQIYETNGEEPTVPLFVYDAKTTIDEVTIDDWYNFRMSWLDPSIPNIYSGRFALVMTATGIEKSNFVMWEMVDNDEYTALPSAFRTIDA